eukprot:1180356-Prorocentrum_minimum.AAC.7
MEAYALSLTTLGSLTRMSCIGESPAGGSAAASATGAGRDWLCANGGRRTPSRRASLAKGWRE